jgi:hypothetical protein
VSGDLRATSWRTRARRTGADELAVWLPASAARVSGGGAGFARVAIDLRGCSGLNVSAA